MRLLKLCSELESVIGNTYFRKNGINKFELHRIDNGRMVKRVIMDYVLVERSVLGRLVDVHVARVAEEGMSDHILEIAKLN